MGRINPIMIGVLAVALMHGVVAVLAKKHPQPVDVYVDEPACTDKRKALCE